ncbi:MAG: SRPBCC family protein [Acidimicrobiales bacterium]
MVRSDRRVTFTSPPEVVWEAMTRTGDYTGWWPWLRRLDAAGLVAGDVWGCHVQPPLPYSLRFRITIGEVVPGRSVVATVTGDITGSASVELSPGEGEATVVHVVSDLAPSASALRAFARVARPLVTWGHDWVIDQGVRQFRARALGPP